MEKEKNVEINTIPRLFWDSVKSRGERVAMREKDLGIWQEISWSHYGEKAKLTGLALHALGLEKGNVVSIASEGNPEWLYTDMGTIGAGGISSGVYTTDSAAQVKYLVNDSATKFYFAENEEQLDKILEVRGECPTLKQIIVYDMEGLNDFHDDQVISYEEFLKIGEKTNQENPDLWESLVNSVSPDDIAILVYTSGTTGPSKGAMINHTNLLYSINTGYDIFDVMELSLIHI